MPGPSQSTHFDEFEGLDTLREEVNKFHKKSEHLTTASKGSKPLSLAQKKYRIMATLDSQIKFLINEFNRLDPPQSEELRLYYNGVLALRIMSTLALQKYEDLETLVRRQSYAGVVANVTAKLGLTAGAVVGSYMTAGLLPAVAAYFGANYVGSKTVKYMFSTEAPESLKRYERLMVAAQGVLEISFKTLELAKGVVNPMVLDDIKFVYCDSEEEYLNLEDTSLGNIYVYPTGRDSVGISMKSREAQKECHTVLDGIDWNKMQEPGLLKAGEKELIQLRFIAAVALKVSSYSPPASMKVEERKLETLRWVDMGM